MELGPTISANYQKIDHFYLPQPNYLSGRKITGKHRAILVNWLFGVIFMLRLKYETFLLTTNIIDRYIAKKELDLKKLQLLGCSGLRLASMIRDVETIDEASLVSLSDDQYSITEIHDTSMDILIALGGDLDGPIISDLIGQFSPEMKLSKLQNQILTYIVLCTTLSYNLSWVPTPLLAIACIKLTLLVQGPQLPIDNLVYYSPSNVELVMKNIIKIIVSSPSSSINDKFLPSTVVNLNYQVLEDWNSAEPYKSIDDHNNFTGKIFFADYELQYQVGERIGRGSYGSIYKIKELSSGATYAVKRIYGLLTESTVREITSLVKLSHIGCSQIINLHAVYIQNSMINLILDYQPLDLFKYIRTPDFDPQRQFVGLALPIAQGLNFLHQWGMVHRDVKPANILIGEDRSIKLADFGTSKSVTRMGSKNSRLTTDVYTPGYRPPEILLGDTRYDGYSADVWAYGCTVSEIYLQKCLFWEVYENDDLKYIYQLLGTPTHQTYPQIDELPSWQPHLPKYRSNISRIFPDPSFQKFIANILIINPKERFSMRQIVEVLMDNTYNLFQ